MELGQAWGQHLLAALLKPDILHLFDSDPDLGVIGPPGSLHPISLNLGDNAAWLSRLCMGDLKQKNLLLTRQFLGGSMFVARTDALNRLFLLHLKIEDFELESGQLDGTLSHGLERWIGIMAEVNGFRLDQLSGDKSLVPGFGFDSAKKFVPKQEKFFKSMPS